MKIPRIAESVGYIDDDLIESAANAGISVRRLPIRRLVYVAICAIIAIIACLTVYAISGGTDWFVPMKGAGTPPSDDVPAVKEFVSPEGEKYFLRYDAEIDHQNAYPLYSYTDDHGNYYYYNKDGEFVRSWHNVDDETILDKIKEGDDSLKVSEDEAREIAEKYLLACHGEEFFDKYEFVRIGGNDHSQVYNLYYNILYGKEKFIKGQLATVGVRYDGIVFIHSITNPQTFENFNFDVLVDISKKDIESFIDGILNEVGILEYDEEKKPVWGYESYEINDIQLCRDGDEYCIGVSTYVYSEWVNRHESIISFQPYHEPGAYLPGNKPDDSVTPKYFVTFSYPLENK